MKFDVIVVGGGTTGTCAAVAAARSGATTALVEQEGFLGGNAASGLPWLGFHHPFTNERVVGGLPEEIVEDLRRRGGATRMERDPICGSVVCVNSVLLQLVLIEKSISSGMHLFLHTRFLSCRGEDKNWHVELDTPSGRDELTARIMIDATDSGAVAFAAGARLSFGREGDHLPQVASSVVRFGDVDVQELVEYFQAHPHEMRPFKIEERRLRNYIKTLPQADCFVVGAFPSLVAQAKSEGLAYPRDRVVGVVNAKEREFISVCSRVTGADPRNTKSYTEAECTGFRQLDVTCAMLHRLPGFRNSRPVSIGHTLGLRETYHLEGEYTLSARDLMSGRHFSDSIARGGYHIDIHSPDGPGLESRTPPPFEIPFRCIVPKGIPNLMVVGRCLSATHEAQAAVRTIPILGAVGESVGRIAAGCPIGCSLTLPHVKAGVEA